MSYTETLPGREFNGHGQHFSGTPADELPLFSAVADPDIFETLDLTLTRKEIYEYDAGNAAVLNEAAVRLLKPENPFELTIDRGTLGKRDVDIVGVVKDFHFKFFILQLSR